jgi:CDP-glycerol glycerophosphotransferase
VLDALADLDGVRERMAGPLARFTETFCSLEDGHATERVLDLILPRLAGGDELPRRSA